MGSVEAVQSREDSLNGVYINFFFDLGKIVFFVLSGYFLLSGIFGPGHDVAGFYKSIFFLSGPLVIETLRGMWSDDKEDRFYNTKEGKLYITCLGLAGIVLLFSLILLLRNVWNNKSWGWSILLIPVFLFPYLVMYFRNPIKKFFRGRQMPQEKRPDS